MWGDTEKRDKEKQTEQGETYTQRGSETERYKDKETKKDTKTQRKIGGNTYTQRKAEKVIERFRETERRIERECE